jgi:anthranilate synthase component 2
MHGKTSPVHHRAVGVFAGLPNPLTTRYHSLVVEQRQPARLPGSHRLDRRRRRIMGVRHKTLAVEGVQFHPESILTEHGHACCARTILNA